MYYIVTAATCTVGRHPWVLKHGQQRNTALAHLPNPGVHFGSFIFETIWKVSLLRTHSKPAGVSYFLDKMTSIKKNTVEMTPLARAHLSLDTQRSTELSASHTQEMVAE